MNKEPSLLKLATKHDVVQEEITKAYKTKYLFMICHGTVAKQVHRTMIQLPVQALYCRELGCARCRRLDVYGKRTNSRKIHSRTLRMCSRIIRNMSNNKVN